MQRTFGASTEQVALEVIWPDADSKSVKNRVMSGRRKNVPAMTLEKKGRNGELGEG